MNGNAGIGYHSSTTGSITGCTILDSSRSITSSWNSHIDISGCRLIEGDFNLTISDFSTASGSDNFLDRGGWASIRVTENSETIDFRNNNIHIGGDWCVYCQHTNNPINEIVNLENNYWGGADSTAIAEVSLRIDHGNNFIIS